MGNFEITDNFYLDGKPFQIISGAIHYFRIVPEYWQDRLEKLKAMGCNTVETYIPWNMHEPKKGEFHFEGMLDIERFVKTAQELGLYVILRPSPYICAEWEFGGLPAWLLAEDGMKLRVSYPPFLKHVQDYYDVLLKKIVPYQINYGGPVILMQVENEYGYYANDREYLLAMRDKMQKGGVVVPLVTSDGPFEENLNGGHLEGALPTGNFGSKTEERFEAALYLILPLFCFLTAKNVDTPAINTAAASARICAASVKSRINANNTGSQRSITSPKVNPNRILFSGRSDAKIGRAVSMPQPANARMYSTEMMFPINIPSFV